MVDRREVWKVCDKLRAAGRKVTYRAVAGALEEGGSFRDVGPELRPWKKERDYRPRLELADMPKCEAAWGLCADRHGIYLIEWQGLGQLAVLKDILRPFNWPEAIWAIAGAVLLVALQLLSPKDALAGIGKGVDVYLFLTGMMLLSETARQEGILTGWRRSPPSAPTARRAACFCWSTSSVRSSRRFSRTTRPPSC